MEHQLFVPSSNGALIDARVLCLDPKHPNASFGLILTHPYALLGGNMHNNVVIELYKKFATLGFTVCRMDFR